MCHVDFAGYFVGGLLVLLGSGSMYLYDRLCIFPTMTQLDNAPLDRLDEQCVRRLGQVTSSILSLHLRVAALERANRKAQEQATR